MGVRSILWSSFVVAACSNTVEPSEGGASDAGKDARPQRDAFEEAAPSCIETKMCPTPSPDPQAECAVTFETKLLDMMGAPVAGETVFYCGTNLCTAPLPSDAQGTVRAEICAWFVRGALKYRGAGHVSFTTLAPLGPNPVIPPATLVPLPMQGVDLPGSSGGDVTSGGVTLTVPPNAKITFDPGEPMSVDLERFRAAAIPAAIAPPLIDPMLKLEVFWGLAPVNGTIVPLPALKIPNSKGWPANATVEVFLNGNDSYEATPPIPWGDWGPIGTAHVSADAQWVTTDVGGGIPRLGIVAFRLKL